MSAETLLSISTSLSSLAETVKKQLRVQEEQRDNEKEFHHNIKCRFKDFMHMVKGKLTIQLPGRQKAETEMDAGEEESEEEPEVEDMPSQPMRGFPFDK